LPLIDLDLTIDPAPMPGDVRAFLREAQRRVQRFCKGHHIPGFVPSDFRAVYTVLRAVAESDLAPCDLFCEWGSGHGVVTCLASLLGFNASGIEIEADLVDASQELAEDFDLPVHFVQGSFIPGGRLQMLGPGEDFAWLTSLEDRAHEELGLDPDEYGVVFAYPWPDEEWAIEALFEQCAGPQALLMTYHGLGTPRIRRKR
jgi:hypothetical protein